MHKHQLVQPIATGAQRSSLAHANRMALVFVSAFDVVLPSLASLDLIPHPALRVPPLHLLIIWYTATAAACVFRLPLVLAAEEEMKVKLRRLWTRGVAEVTSWA